MFLRQSFARSVRVMNIVRIFDQERGAANGYELLKRLLKEYSVVTSAEGYYFRNIVQQFKVPEANSGTTKDVVMCVEAELLLYERLCNSATTTNGLEM